MALFSSLAYVRAQYRRSRRLFFENKHRKVLKDDEGVLNIIQNTHNGGDFIAQPYLSKCIF